MLRRGGRPRAAAPSRALPSGGGGARSGPATGPPAAPGAALGCRPLWQAAALPEELAFDVRLTFVHVHGQGRQEQGQEPRSSSPSLGRSRSAPPCDVFLRL